MNKHISAGAVLLVTALYFFSGPEGLAPLLLAVSVHELGHAAAIVLSGGKIRELRFGASGLSMVYTGLVSPKAELFSIAMGPAAGAVCGLVTLRTAPLFSYMNLFLSAYNLLPALPLDGGRLLYHVLSNRRGIDCAGHILTVSGILSGAAVMLAGLYILYRQLGPIFLLAGINILIYQTFLHLFF